MSICQSVVQCELDNQQMVDEELEIDNTQGETETVLPVHPRTACDRESTHYYPMTGR